MSSLESQFIFQILLTQENNFWVAICLDLDIVTASLNKNEVLRDIRSLIQEQVSYCMLNDNLEYLYRRTPENIQSSYEQSGEVKYFKLYCSFNNQELICGELLL